MMCCVGLFGGAVVGQAMGGPWTVIGPIAGFGVGLVADAKVVKALRETRSRQPNVECRAPGAVGPEENAEESAGQPPGSEPAAAPPVASSSACCGVASGLTRLFWPERKGTEAELPRAQTGQEVVAAGCRPLRGEE